jgi:hypothetical protein
MIKLLLSLLMLVTVSSAANKTVMNPYMLEDTFTLYALDAQVHQKYHIASKYFAELYKQTSKKEYLYQSLRMLEQSKETKAFSKKTADALLQSPDDVTLLRFEIVGLLKAGNFGEASQKGLLLSDKTKKASDYLLYAEARLKLSDYIGSVDAMKKAYALTYDDATAERITLIQYAQLGEKTEAIKFLKDHISIHGNSKVIGKRLASFYADSGKFDDAAQMYEQTYELDSDPAIAEEAVKVYAYQQDLSKMSIILEKSHINDPLLLDIYVRNKVFDKASALALKLYDHEDNILYLAQGSIYAYEAAKDKKDPIMLNTVVDGLKKATKDLDDPLYLNYLGYLMIDHDLNVSEGMGYVNRALEKQPESPFYIDSLAWGHYKLRECDEALKLIKKVESMIGTDEEEVKEHLKAIETCKTKEVR